MKLAYISKYLMLTMLILNTVFLAIALNLFIHNEISLLNVITVILNEATFFILERMAETNIEIQNLILEYKKFN